MQGRGRGETGHTGTILDVTQGGFKYTTSGLEILESYTDTTLCLGNFSIPSNLLQWSHRDYVILTIGIFLSNSLSVCLYLLVYFCSLLLSVDARCLSPEPSLIGTDGTRT